MGLFDGTALERAVLCDRCNLDVKVCQCLPLPEAELPEVAPEKQRLKVRVEKRKKGKIVTVVSGFSGSATQRQEVLVKLKNSCGAGGTIDEDDVIVQGDHQTRVIQQLKESGFRVATKG